MDEEHVWVTGGDTQIRYRKHIGSGAVGDVHEVRSMTVSLTFSCFRSRVARFIPSASIPLTDFQSFARKIIRISGTLQKADVQNEAQVVSLILALGGHVNIVNILRHDWLKHSFNQCYYIDMELCEFSLFDYIAHHNSMKADITSEIAIYNHLSPVVVKKNCSAMQKVQNIWAIGLHIARGLEFMHTHNHAHRDLKPGNGMYDAKKWIDLVVLYSLRDNLWKLADFGL
jgi:serine/threonine protein kinase